MSFSTSCGANLDPAARSPLHAEQPGIGTRPQRPGRAAVPISAQPAIAAPAQVVGEALSGYSADSDAARSRW